MISSYLIFVLIGDSLTEPPFRDKSRVRPVNLRDRHLEVLALLAVMALALAVALSTGASQAARSLAQDSPVSPVEQTPPALETATPEPTATTLTAPTATPSPSPSSEEMLPEAAPIPEPPIPVAALAGLMLVIGLIALVIALRRR